MFVDLGINTMPRQAGGHPHRDRVGNPRHGILNRVAHGFVPTLPSSEALRVHEKKLTKLETRAFSLPLPRLRAPGSNRHLANKSASRCILLLRRRYSNNLLPTSPPRELHRAQPVETGMGINKGASRCKGNKTPSGVLIKRASNGFQSPKDDPGDGEGAWPFVGLDLLP